MIWGEPLRSLYTKYSGGSRRGAPSYFYTKLRPEGQKKFFGDRPPPYLRVWMTGPHPYLKVWIPH